MRVGVSRRSKSGWPSSCVLAVAPATLTDVQAVTSAAELIEARAMVDATTVDEAIVNLE